MEKERKNKTTVVLTDRQETSGRETQDLEKTKKKSIEGRGQQTGIMPC